MNFILVFFIPFVVSLGVGFCIIRITLKFNLFDFPDDRSSHTRPTPTMGGFAIVIAFFVGMILVHFFPSLWQEPRWIWWFVAGAGLMVVHGFIDDLRPLPPLLRFILFSIVAGMAVAGGIRLNTVAIPLFGTIELGILEIPMTIVWIIAVTCFFNFMDGIDGLADGVGVIVTGFLAYIAWEMGNTEVLIMSSLLGGSCLGFLLYNFPPAKIFMGDVGSIFIGYTLAVLALIGNQRGQPVHIPLIVPVLLLGAFLFDTGVTAGRRILRREKWYLSHRQHYYQRMINLGLSHLQITLGEYGITCLLGISALLYIRANQALASSILVIWLVIFIGLIRMIVSLEKKRFIKGRERNG